MSSADLIREPAWQGLTPGLPEWTEVPAMRAQSILASAGLSGTLLERSGDAAGTQFKITKGGERDLFLKHVPAARAASEERAQSIAGWLAGRGVPVAVPCAGYPRRLADGSLFVAMPYVHGKRLDPEPEQLRALGRIIAALHAALAAHPDVASWSTYTKQRMTSLANTRQALATRRVSCGPLKERLAELAADEDVDFVLSSSMVAALHGDLNPGNVLLDAETGLPRLLDFEDVFHSLLPPAFEMMLVIERFVLARLRDEASIRGCTAALLTGYREAGGHRLEFGIKPADVLRSLAVRSLCVLCQGAQRGIDVSASEWSKFFSLEEAARQSADMINGVVEEIVA
jgi:Ser/Thr protein kinase RdoA (MazF antagonist)